MRPPETSVRPTPRTLLWDLLTFDKLLTGPILHLIYWAGIGLIVLMGFGVVGAAIGVALRDVSIASVLLAIPVLVGGLLVTQPCCCSGGACASFSWLCSALPRTSAICAPPLSGTPSAPATDLRHPPDASSQFG
jgi:hypothetical protein